MDYSPDPREFERWIMAAKSRTGSLDHVGIGLGAYKLVHSVKAFEREFRFAESAGAAACVIFHYGSIIRSPAMREFMINGSGRPQSDK
jgi:hypothetical protein